MDVNWEQRRAEMEPMRILVFMEEQELSRPTECKGYVARVEHRGRREPEECGWWCSVAKRNLNGVVVG